MCGAGYQTEFEVAVTLRAPVISTDNAKFEQKMAEVR
jgi:hypothetical protein